MSARTFDRGATTWIALTTAAAAAAALGGCGSRSIDGTTPPLRS